MNVQDVDFLSLQLWESLPVYDLENWNTRQSTNGSESVNVCHVFSHVVLCRKLELGQQFNIRVKKFFFPKERIFSLRQGLVSSGELVNYDLKLFAYDFGSLITSLQNFAYPGSLIT